MKRVVSPALALALAGGLALAACGASSRAQTAPAGTAATATVRGLAVGVMFDGPALSPAVDLNRQMALAARSGVQSLRVAVSWAATQPSPSAPANFAATDRVVLAAARHRLSLLPVVLYTPAWAGSGPPNSPPRDPATYARFLTALVDRYGPGGSLWSANPSIPKVPVRRWQIWNEPDFSRYWAPQPFAPSYVRLLAAAHIAIKAADPGAQVVLAGLPEFSWEYLAQILAVPGAVGDFDLAAAHPYTAQPAGVITILRRDRAALDAHGARNKPLLATEITWPSSQGKAPPQFGVGVTEAAQARLIGQVMPMLAAHRRALRLAGVYWYTWMGDERSRYAFDYAGLLAYRGGRIVTKPALAAFRRAAHAAER